MNRRYALSLRVSDKEKEIQDWNRQRILLIRLHSVFSVLCSVFCIQYSVLFSGNKLCLKWENVIKSLPHIKVGRIHCAMNYIFHYTTLGSD